MAVRWRGGVRVPQLTLSSCDSSHGRNPVLIFQHSLEESFPSSLHYHPLVRVTSLFVPLCRIPTGCVPGLVFLMFVAAGVPSVQAQVGEERPALVVQAVQEAVTIDGRLDEAAWEEAEVVSAFRQFDPQEGAPASQQTEVQVLYGPNSLYIGARLYDDQPTLIERTLGRRDELNRADWFLVSIDSYFDRRTAYVFGINAAGVQYDAIRAGGGGGGGPLPGADPSWDAIWYASVRVMPDGWSVEMRIPYSMLRFSEADEQTWGIHFMRRIPRRGEQAEWPLVPRTERSNLVAQFGLLTGLQQVAPRRNVQLRPYTVAQLQSEEDASAPNTATRNTSIDAGLDVKVGLGPNITLDATFNPDFGQVESDPAVLNLTAFETVFEERRPFFVEGSQIYAFSAGPGNLLYTRRIGAADPIVGAAKVSGRTGSGFSFGVLGATTGDDFDPSRHYGVARASQQVGTFSSVGGILTAFDAPAAGEDARRRSISSGTDWDVRLLNNRFGIEGFAAVTHRRLQVDDADAETGFAGKVWVRRRQGVLTGFVGLDVFGDQFNPNDMGLLRENNFVAVLNQLAYEINGGQPFGPFLRAGAEAFTIQRFSYEDGRNLGLNVDVGSEWTLRGFQQVEVAAEVQRPFGGYDLFETRGLGPWNAPTTVDIGGEFETDERRTWQVEPEVSLGFQEGGGRAVEIGVRGDWNVGTRLSLSLNVEGEREDDVLAWSSNESFRQQEAGWDIGRESRSPRSLGPEGFVAFDDGGQLQALLSRVDPFGLPEPPNVYFVPVFGRRDSRAMDATLRSTVTFTPALSLQLYGQLFVARGRYDQFQILQTPDDLAAFDAFPKRDEFAFSSVQANVVMRWEYRPGSTLFVVWTHNRNAEDTLNPLGPWGASPYDRMLDQQVGDTFDIFPSNIFLVKLNYTFLY